MTETRFLTAKQIADIALKKAYADGYMRAVKNFDKHAQRRKRETKMDLVLPEYVVRKVMEEVPEEVWS